MNSSSSSESTDEPFDMTDQGRLRRSCRLTKGDDAGTATEAVRDGLQPRRQVQTAQPFVIRSAARQSESSVANYYMFACFSSRRR